jgi:hypothetical protein
MLSSKRAVLAAGAVLLPGATWITIAASGCDQSVKYQEVPVYEAGVLDTTQPPMPDVALPDTAADADAASDAMEDASADVASDSEAPEAQANDGETEGGDAEHVDGADAEHADSAGDSMSPEAGEAGGGEEAGDTGTGG